MPRKKVDQVDDADATQVKGIAFVHRQFLQGGRLLSEEISDYQEDEIPVIAVRKFVGPHATAGVELFQQWNMGHDNLVASRIIVSIPCYTEELDDAYTWVDRWATEKMQAEDAAIQKQLRNKRKQLKGE